MAAGAVSLRKSHDIVILSFCNIVKRSGYIFFFQLFDFFVTAPPPSTVSVKSETTPNSKLGAGNLELSQ